MASLVVGHQFPVLLLNDRTLPLGTHDYLVAGKINVPPRYRLVAGRGAVQGCLVDEVSQVGSCH